MRYIQHPVTHKLIPAEEYYGVKERSHSISPDIEPFVSSVDGTIIGSRKALEEHNKRHNVVTVAEYGGHVDKAAQKRRHDHYQGKRTTAESFARKQELHEIINHLERS